ncbi:BamA/TamA family outer membrane protein [Pontibacter sp. CAU 1760]
MPHPHHKPHPVLLALLLGLLLLVWSPVCEAQAVPTTAPQDTVTADTTHMRFDERMIQNLRKMSERKTIMGKLLKSVLVFDRKEEEVYGLDAELIQREYEKHTYKIVRRIDIMSLDAFGYSIHDTARVPRNIFEKLGNSLHVKTGRGLIRNKLLFEKLAPLEPLALVESERLLRQTAYLLDARIIVNEETTTQDSVDVLVITKDIFSLGGSGSYSPSSGRGRITLRELNFLGQGHQVEGSYRFNPNAPRPWEAAGYYTVENIGRTYITADVAYVDKNFYQEKSALLRRDFFATNTKYAGAVGVSSIGERIMLSPTAEDTIPRYSNLAYTRQDAWLGRSFKFKTYNLGYEPRGRLILGARFINTNYSVKATENFQDNTLIMASLGYSIRKYYKDRFLFGFGRTEDIPAGTLLSLTGGYEHREFDSRKYLGAALSFAKYTPSFGYLYGKLSYDSFLREGQWEQGVMQLESLYFTKLSEWNNWKLRHFLWGRGTWGINRNPEELLSINNENGIRGFRSSLLRGSRRVTFNYEANLYTPFSLFGFKLATVFFADVAWLSKGNNSIPFRDKPYRGYGIGFRFRNEYLSFSTIQFLISYYPKLPPNENINGFKVFESSRPYYDFRDFQFSRPGVAEFN